MILKTLINAKLLRIRFDRIYGSIRVYDGSKYLVLFGSEKYDFIYNRIRHLIGGKGGMLFLIIMQKSNRFIRFFTSRKKMTFYNVIILIKLVFNKNKNNYDYNIFLEKASYELPKK